MYGFAMLDAGYNFGQIDPAWFDVVRPTKLPAFENEFGPSGNVFFSVRQTRWGVKTTYPTGIGDLKTIFEFELFGTGVDAGQTTFRLRHAWGELGQVGAGQTWSPFMDPDVFPNSIEYWGPNGMVFFRNIQARWTPWRRGDSDFIIAAERPGASADGGVYAGRIELAGVTPQFTLPDISSQVRWAGNKGHVQVAGIFRKISWVDLNKTPTLNIHGTVYGWGINASANLKLKADTGRFSVVYGHGIENYMNDAPIDVGIKNNFGNPTNPVTGEALPVLGIVAFDDHNWSDKFSSTIGYSYENISNAAQQAGVRFPSGSLCAGESSLLPHQERDDGAGVSIWPACELRRWMELQRLPSAVLLQVQLRENRCVCGEMRGGKITFCFAQPLVLKGSRQRSRAK